MWKLLRANQDVDQWKQIKKTFVNVVDISRNDRSSLFRGSRQHHTRRRIVRVEMQHSSQGRKLGRRFLRFVSKPLVTVPDDGPFATARVDGDERDLVLRIFDHFGKVAVDTFAGQ